MIEVIVTNYNSGKFAHSALQSLAKQTMQPDRVVIVDDCSTDNSIELIRKACADLPKTISWDIVKTDTNHGGPAKARNLGLSKCNGDILCLLDIDDWYSPDKIRRSVEVLQTYPAVGLVYTDYIMEMIREGVSRREFKHPYEFGLLAQTCIVSTNSIGRTRLFKESSGWDERMKIADDYHMWVQLAKKSVLWHLPEALFHYRVHDASLTQNKANLMQQEVEMIKRDLLS